MYTFSLIQQSLILAPNSDCFVGLCERAMLSDSEVALERGDCSKQPAHPHPGIVAYLEPTLAGWLADWPALNLLPSS